MTWVHDLVGWLRTVLGVEERPPQPLEVIVDQNGDCKAFLLFSDRSSPVEGIVEIWLLRHELSATRDCLLLLINIAQIRETYGSGWDDLDSAMLPDHWRRAFEYRAKAEIKLQSSVAGSHLLMVGWLSKKAIASRVVHGKLEHYRHIDCQRVYAVDLIGTLYYQGINEPARKILRSLVRRAISITPGNLNIWEELIFSLGEAESKTTWLDWLAHYARVVEVTRISRDHVLQPPRSSFRHARDE